MTLSAIIAGGGNNADNNSHRPRAAVVPVSDNVVFADDYLNPDNGYIMAGGQGARVKRIKITSANRYYVLNAVCKCCGKHFRFDRLIQRVICGCAEQLKLFEEA